MATALKGAIGFNAEVTDNNTILATWSRPPGDEMLVYFFRVYIKDPAVPGMNTPAHAQQCSLTVTLLESL